jgi:hypothetical protein
MVILASENNIVTKNICTKMLSRPEAFWNYCGESDTKTASRSHLDPVLKLYPGCPIKYSESTDIHGGLANRSMAKVEKLCFTRFIFMGILSLLY